MNSISLASFHFSSDKAGIFLENFFLPGALLGDLVRHKTVQGTCTGLDGESVSGAGQWGGRQAEEGGSPMGALVPSELTSSALPPWLCDGTLRKRCALHPGLSAGALPLPPAFRRPLGLCPWKAWTALPWPALFTQSQDRTEVRFSTR